MKIKGLSWKQMFELGLLYRINLHLAEYGITIIYSHVTEDVEIEVQDRPVERDLSKAPDIMSKPVVKSVLQSILDKE